MQMHGHLMVLIERLFEKEDSGEANEESLCQ